MTHHISEILSRLMTLDDYRQFYADEVRLAAGLDAGALAAAFARVPRERFMGTPPWRVLSADRASLAFIGVGGKGYLSTDNPKDLYHNVLVALDPERHLNNGQPSALACWMDALELKAGDRVYHLGCGVGYYTAIMAEVVGADGTVAASEVHEGLATRAIENLAVYPNVSVHGAAFDPGDCGAIFINAGVTHPHPLWLERLSRGGRLVLPLTVSMDSANAGTGIVARIIRQEHGFSASVVSVVGIYSCTSVRDSDMNAALAKALATKALFKVKSVRTDQHQQEETCVAHGRDFCLSTADLPSTDQPSSLR
jgi:protein-L-isoaspartate(D-aspartate) O-methyltransferase